MGLGLADTNIISCHNDNCMFPMITAIFSGATTRREPFDIVPTEVWGLIVDSF